MPLFNEYDPKDDPLEEEGYGQGNNSNEYAFAKNNSSAFFSKSTPFQRPLTTIDDQFSPSDDKQEEDRQIVVFLTTEEEVNGESYPVDYQKEYFGNTKDAQSFIDSMKQSGDGKKYDGYIVPVDKEKEAEQRMNELINTGNEGEGELDQGTQDREGAYWSEANETGDEMFDALNKICQNKKCSPEQAVAYLVKTKGLDETEAEAVLLAYEYSRKPMKENRIREGYPPNLKVVQAFIDGTNKPTKSKNLKIVKFPNGWGLVNYYTLLAYISGGTTAYFNYQKYSITTTKIQNGLHWRLKKAYPNMIMANEEEIKETAEGKIVNISPMPKNVKASYNKLPMNPHYYQDKLKHTIVYADKAYYSPDEIPEPIDPNFDPFAGEEMFNNEEDE